MDRPVIIMAATNRRRCSTRLCCGPVASTGRWRWATRPHRTVQILKIHSKASSSPATSISTVRPHHPRIQRADLANAMNEAALLAARRRAESVGIKDFEAAMERVIAGLEKRTRVMNEAERKTVAYHESGHALVAALLPHSDPVAKISIIPRARGALGYTCRCPPRTATSSPRTS